MGACSDGREKRESWGPWTYPEIWQHNATFVPFGASLYAFIPNQGDPSASQGETGLPRAEHWLFPTNMPFGAFSHPRVKQAPSVSAWRSGATWARSEIMGSPGSLGEAKLSSLKSSNSRNIKEVCMCMTGSRKSSHRRRREWHLSVADGLGALCAQLGSAGLGAHDLGWTDRVQQVACLGFLWSAPAPGGQWLPPRAQAAAAPSKGASEGG